MRITLFSSIMIAIYASNVFSGGDIYCMLNNQDAKEHRLNDTRNIVHAYAYELYHTATSRNRLPLCDAFNKAFAAGDNPLLEDVLLTRVKHAILWQRLDCTHDYMGLAGVMNMIINKGNALQYIELGEIKNMTDLEERCTNAVSTNNASLIRLCIAYIAETVEYSTIGNSYTMNINYEEGSEPFTVIKSQIRSPITQAHYSDFKGALNILFTNAKSEYTTTFKDGTPPPIPDYAKKPQ